MGLDGGVATDGKNIYYSRPSDQGIATMPAGGGTPKSIVKFDTQYGRASLLLCAQDKVFYVLASSFSKSGGDELHIMGQDGSNDTVIYTATGKNRIFRVFAHDKTVYPILTSQGSDYNTYATVMAMDFDGKNQYVAYELEYITGQVRELDQYLTCIAMGFSDKDGQREYTAYMGYGASADAATNRVYECNMTTDSTSYQKNPDSYTRHIDPTMIDNVDTGKITRLAYYNGKLYCGDGDVFAKEVFDSTRKKDEEQDKELYQLLIFKDKGTMAELIAINKHGAFFAVPVFPEGAEELPGGGMTTEAESYRVARVSLDRKASSNVQDAPAPNAAYDGITYFAPRFADTGKGIVVFEQAQDPTATGLKIAMLDYDLKNLREVG